MKKLILCLLTLTASVFSQNFTWINGTNSISAVSNYGTQGISAPSNSPGERHGSAKWVDNSGNLWFFGGEAPLTSWWNDLWKYNISTNEWTWIRGANTPNALANYGTLGVSSPTNNPGAREFPAYWTDNSGNFWLFGGYGYDGVVGTGNLSDLWKYSPITNEWTWVKGQNVISQPGIYGTQGVSAPANMPGGRQQSGHWMDLTGNLWLFGGVGQTSTTAQGRLNDLWKYDIVSNNWTWMNGSNGPNPYGVYGTLSTPSPTNHPGGRFSPSCWQIGADMYLFGGFGRDSSSQVFSFGHLNDLWKYNSSANAWVWLGGSPFANPSANYGIQGISNPANVPGPRQASASWVDANNNVWLFGGLKTALPADIFFNDLFRYNSILNEWTWMKGSNLPDQNGTYGTLGISAPTNMPGARAYSTFWTDLTGKFWLFGGEGFDAASTGDGHLNDLWSFTTPCNPDSITIAPGKILCSGTNATLTAINGGNSTIWYPTATSTSSISGGNTLALSSLTATGSQTVFSYYAEANSCTTTPRPSISITVNPLPIINTVSSVTIMCYYSPVTFTASGANSYTWNTNPPTTNSVLTVAPTSGAINNILTYTVTGTDVNNCTAVATATVKAFGCAGIKEGDNSSIFKYSLYPNPSKGEFTIKTDVFLEGAKLRIINALGEKVYSQTMNSYETKVMTDLIKGIYFYVISNGEKTISTGKLIIE
ncbi:kelch repeat-containing protein [Aurantibacillus circumpalustris]|uniref:kelch repeat-containing protein n=1 Tax=Aurantibacillus circumpalustris TaxID=3036359 RepID=UPI00295BC047|nr:kelch repeat-containing protein [Aurantibacillus circumpalustris]